SAVPDRYAAIGRLFNPDAPASGDAARTALADSLQSLRESLGVTDRLGDLGVTKKDLPELAKKAIHDPCIATNPRTMTVADIEKIYEKAL
ncbi:MAG: iron-containing alcohol dehydrogenase, partial [Methanomicrobiales archaeon]|nr:iron-containing alcohol dehydrogenase [Methanomicrobiales archaeon]